MTAAEQDEFEAMKESNRMVREELFRLESLFNGNKSMNIKGLREEVHEFKDEVKHDLKDIKSFIDDVNKAIVSVKFLFKFLVWVGGFIIAVSAIVHDWFDIFK